MTSVTDKAVTLMPGMVHFHILGQAMITRLVLIRLVTLG